MIREWIGKDLEGRGRSLMKVVSRNLLGGTEEEQKLPDSWIPDIFNIFNVNKHKKTQWL
jgi:hypothetical protein